MANRIDVDVKASDCISLGCCFIQTIISLSEVDRIKFRIPFTRFGDTCVRSNNKLRCQ